MKSIVRNFEEIELADAQLESIYGAGRLECELPLTIKLETKPVKLEAVVECKERHRRPFRDIDLEQGPRDGCHRRRPYTVELEPDSDDN